MDSYENLKRQKEAIEAKELNKIRAAVVEECCAILLEHGEGQAVEVLRRQHEKTK